MPVQAAVMAPRSRWRTMTRSDFGTGRPGAERSIDAGQKLLKSIWFASDKLLITAGFDSVELWDAASGMRIRGLGSSIRDADVTDDGATLALMRSDRISFRDMGTDTEIQSVTTPKYAGGILLAGGGATYLAGTEIREVATGRMHSATVTT
jgi:hypothetical protein